MLSLFLCALVCDFAANVRGQQAGPVSPEVHPPFSAQQCTKGGGCKEVPGELVLDSQWRWLHEKGGYTNCLADGKWSEASCPSAETCAKKCELEGLNVADYSQKVGLDPIAGGVRLHHVAPKGAVASRVYLLEDRDHYRMFKLKNREFSVTVDASTPPCGLNGALYFVEMPRDGGKDGALNNAGAAYGTGYCDAQCPRDMKFIPKLGANLEDYKQVEALTPELEKTTIGPIGRHGACCAEMDIFEANREASALTAHPCSYAGLHTCAGEECGNKDKAGSSPCDQDGCGFNPYRVGQRNFFGSGANHAVDTSKPVTMVTQFITSDNTDAGDLVEIRRIWVQDGKVISNAKTANLPGSYDSITDDYCDAQGKTYNSSSDVFKKNGGLKAMGEALERGMVLTMSIWDDGLGRMLWLDGEKGKINQDASQPGVSSGPCPFRSGEAVSLRKSASASVAFTDVKFGEIGSTLPGALEALEVDQAPALAQVQRHDFVADSVVDHSTVHFIQKRARAITAAEL